MRSAALCLVAACRFNPAAITDGNIVTPPDAGRPDAPPGTNLWRTDTSDELLTGTLRGTAVARGVVEPEAFATGALRVRSSNAVEFTDPDAAAWATLDALTPAATALSLLPLDPRPRPGGLGLDADDSWTLWADGEVFLPAGNQGLDLAAADRGFIEIALDGTTFQRLASTGPKATASFMVPADGWYPVHLAMSKTGAGPSRFDLEIDPLGAPPRQPMFGSWFRTPADTMSGVAFTTTDQPFAVRRAAQTLYTGTLLDEDWGQNGPTDMDLGGFSTFGTRWEGQILIDTAGPYSFHVSSDDGHHLYVDRALVSDHWGTGTQDVTVPVQLDAGWHDLVLDHCDTGGNARLHLDVNGAQIAADHLRPVFGRTDRVVMAGAFTGVPTAPDANVDVQLTAPPGGHITLVDVAAEVNHPDFRQVVLKLQPPSNTTLTVFDDNTDTSTGDQNRYATFPAMPAETLSGRWRLQFQDDSGAKDGMLVGYWLTVHYSGGSETVRLASTWTSEVHDFGAPQTFDAVTYQAFTPTGSTLALALRTCTQPCTTEPFVDVAVGATPAVPVGQFAQLRATFTSDGDASPWLDVVDVVGRD